MNVIGQTRMNRCWQRSARLPAYVFMALLGACSSTAQPPPLADADPGVDVAGGGDASRDGDAPQAVVCRPAAPCPTGWYEDSDNSCSPPFSGTPPPCQPQGDGLCYLRCYTDDDCQAVGLSTCGVIYVFGGSDVGRPMSVCDGTKQLPQCPATP